MPICQINHGLWNKKLLWTKTPPIKCSKTTKMGHCHRCEASSNHLCNIFWQLKTFPNLGLKQSFSFTPFSFRLSLTRSCRDPNLSLLHLEFLKSSNQAEHTCWSESQLHCRSPIRVKCSTTVYKKTELQHRICETPPIAFALSEM